MDENDNPTGVPMEPVQPVEPVQEPTPEVPAMPEGMPEEAPAQPETPTE